MAKIDLEDKFRNMNSNGKEVVVIMIMLAMEQLLSTILTQSIVNEGLKYVTAE